MLTQFLSQPGISGTCLHNTTSWQVTELMGGLAAELLLKRRDVGQEDRAKFKLSLHDCYPSVFMQGDDAESFLKELTAAQANLSPAQVDSLMLSGYEVLFC